MMHSSSLTSSSSDKDWAGHRQDRPRQQAEHVLLKQESVGKRARVRTFI